MAHDSQTKKEIGILSISLWLTVAFAIAGVVIAILCDSETIMLDGLYGVADVIVTLFAIFVTKKINEPPNERYHFGYAKFEPLMTSVEGTLILTICVGSIMVSIQDIIHNETTKNLHILLWYSLVSVFICVAFGLYMKMSARKFGSKILSVNSRIWIIEGFLSAAVFIVFGAGFAFPQTILGRYENYIDPVMCITISLILLKEPIQILKEGFLDLVDANPGDQLVREIRSFAEESAQRYCLVSVDQMKIRRAGRKIFAYILFKADQNANIKNLNEIRINMNKDIAKINDKIELIVLF